MHDGRDVGDREVGDDSQQHGFGLVRRKATQEFERSIERRGALGVDVGAGCRSGLTLGPEYLVTVTSPAVAADLVDAAPCGDREEPPTELVGVAGERRQSPCDLDPHRGGQVVRFAHPLAPEITEEQMLMRTPQVTEGFGVPRRGSRDHVLHRPSIGQQRRSA